MHSSSVRKLSVQDGHNGLLGPVLALVVLDIRHKAGPVTGQEHSHARGVMATVGQVATEGSYLTRSGYRGITTQVRERCAHPDLVILHLVAIGPAVAIPCGAHGTKPLCRISPRGRDRLTPLSPHATSNCVVSPA